MRDLSACVCMCVCVYGGYVCVLCICVCVSVCVNVYMCVKSLTGGKLHWSQALGEGMWVR